MKKGQITCSACSHVFAVPANARAAICPRCGQALPVFVGSIEPTEVPPPRPKPPVKHAPSATPSAQLGRIRLKKKPGAGPPPIPPPVPPRSGPPTFSTVPDRTGIQQDLPPLPDAPPGTGLPMDPGGEAQFIPIETEEYTVDDDQETETYDKLGLDGATEQMDHPPWMSGSVVTSPDLPRRPSSPPIDMGYFEGGAVDETDIPAQTGVDLPAPPSSGEYQPDQGRAFTLPWGSEHLNTDTMPGDDPDPLGRVPTLAKGQGPIVPPPPMDLPPPPGAIVPPPPDLPPHLGGPIVPPPPMELPPPPGGSLPPPPGFDELGGSGFDGLPPPPSPEAPTVHGGRKHSPSQRVKALDRAISEVIETDTRQPASAPGWEEPPAPPPRVPTRSLEGRPPPSPPPPPSPGQPAPLSLGHSGIMVAIPDQPIEEVRAGDERPVAPAPRLRQVAPATNELAPISRPPPKSLAKVGSALKKIQKPVQRPTWMIYALIGGVGLAVLTVLIIVLATYSK